MFAQFLNNRIIRQSLLIGLLLGSHSAYAVHLDVELWGEGNTMFAGFCRTANIVGCDLDSLASDLNLPQGTLPQESTTGKLIFIADFQDLTGGPFKTKNPGFQSVLNSLQADELVSYRALGKLRYWEANATSWSVAPTDTQIRLFGGLDAQTSIINNSQQCGGQLFCFSGLGTDQSTVFSADGILAKPELGVDITNNVGILHTHLSFFLENQQGELGGPIGAYLIEMQVFSNFHPIPSAPFLVLLNAGLTHNEFSKALQGLAKAPTSNTPTPPSENTNNFVLTPGDVDFDGDIDRIDVALILLAAQKQEAVKPDGDSRDLDSDSQITRNDAFLAKEKCSLRLCVIPVIPVTPGVAPTARYDVNARLLTLRDVQVEQQHYYVQFQVQDDYRLVLKTAQPQAPQSGQALLYDLDRQQLEIPSVQVHNKYYRALLGHSGGVDFNLEQWEELGNVSD